jgi:hypothetical protein
MKKSFPKGLGTSFKDENTKWLLLSAVVAVAHIAYKFGSLSRLELQGDEAFSVFFAQQTIPELLETLNGEANPPFYYLLLHFWIKLFGIGFVAVKSLNLILSIGTALVLIALSKRVANVGMALFVSICFLFSDLHFDFSHEIRAFQLVLLLTSLSYCFFFAYLQTQKWWYLPLLALVTVGLPMAHYNAVLVPFSQFFVTLFYLREQFFQVVKLWGAYLVAGLLFLPQLLVFRSVVPDDTFWLGLSNWNDLKYIAFKVVGHDRSFYGLIVLYYAAPILAILGKKWAWFNVRFSLRTFFALWLLYVLPLLLNYALAQYVPSFQVRYVLFLSFGVYLSIGYLLAHFERFQLVKLVYFFGITVHMFYFFRPQQRDGEGWKETAAVVSSFQKDKKTLVIVSATYKVRDLLYYLDRSAFADYSNLNARMEKLDVLPAYNSDVLKDSSLFHKYDKVVLILSHSLVQDPNQTVLNEVDKRLHFCYEIGDPIRARIRVYNTQETACVEYSKINEELQASEDCWEWIKRDLLEKNSGKRVEEYEMHWKACKQLMVEEFSPGTQAEAAGVSLIAGSFRYSCTAENSAMVVVSVEHNGQSLKRSEYHMEDCKSGEFKELEFLASAFGDYPEGTVIKVYVWKFGAADVLLNRFKVGFWSK